MVRRLLFAPIFLILISAVTVASETPDERTRFRKFISSVLLCAPELDLARSSECVKSAVKSQPESLKWLSDPDRVELLFQASRLDDLGTRLAARLRESIQEKTKTLTPSVKNLVAEIGVEKWNELMAKGALPSTGYILALANDPTLEKLISKIEPAVFENISRGLRSTLESFQPKEIGTFSDLFASLQATVDGKSEKAQEFVKSLIEEYFSSLTLNEKSKILSDFFLSPIDRTGSERLRPLLQNLDPVMQKIFQLFGRSIKNQAIEEAVSILQSSLTPFPFESMKLKVEERYRRPFDQIFTEYDVSTIRRGTTGQVLFATRIETGERVAIKARTPDILKSFQNARSRLLGLPSVKESQGLRLFLGGILDVIRTELDYREEAKFTDLAQTVYNAPEKGIFAMKRIPGFTAEEDLVVYAFSQGRKPTKLTTISELKLRQRLVTNLIALWTESAFFINVESPTKTTEKTTLFHGDLHPGNILIDSATERMTLLDFGNVGLFPISERRNYIRLYVASLDPNPEEITKLIQEMYQDKGLGPSDFSKIQDIASSVWSNPDLKAKRLDSFLTRSVDEVGLPIEKSISSFTRAIAFLKIEANQINSLLEDADPGRSIPRIDFGEVMKKTLVRNLKKEFPDTLRGDPDAALIDRQLFGDLVKRYLYSRFISPCVNLFHRPQIQTKKGPPPPR